MEKKDTTHLMEGTHALLRRESFGGTLFFVKKGERTYVRHEEFHAIKTTGIIPAELTEKLRSKDVPVVITEPKYLPENNFSAPDTVFLEVTRSCNLACTHCFNSSGKPLADQLTLTELKLIIDDLAASGVQEIRFTGGEPMALPGITSLIKRASLLGLRCSMGTNAMLINDHMADELKDAGLRAGIISLDGLEAQHNLIRGPGSFKRTLEGLERLRNRTIDARVNIVVMRSNYADVISLVTMLAKRGIPIFIRRLILSGRASSSQNEMLSAIEYANLRTLLQPLMNDPNGLVDGHYLKKEKRVVPRIPLPFIRKECSAGHRGLVVLPNGRIQTCGFLGPLGEGSIGTLPAEPFVEIWNRLNGSAYISRLEDNLVPYNTHTTGPKTNCLAIALSSGETL